MTLSNPSEEIRLEAVTELARNPDQLALQHLQRTVASDPSPRVRYYARLALSRVSAAKPDDGKKLTPVDFLNLDLDMKIAVIESVSRKPGPGSTAFLEEVVLCDDLPFIRLKALESLGLCADRPELGFISPFLTVRDPRTVRHAISALRYLGDMNGLLCLPGISCFDVNIVEQEVELFLGDFSGREVAGFLIRRARKGGSASKHAVLRFIDVFFRHDFFPILLELTQEPDESVSMRAEAILEFRKAEFAPADNDDFFFRTLEHYLDPMGDLISEGTMRSLRSRSCSDRIAALMRLLGASSSRLVKDELMVLCDDERDPRVIATLVKALAAMGTLDTLDRIMRFIGHPDARVRANVAESLSLFIGLPWVPGVVRKLMGDPNNRVVANSVVTLAALDPSAAALGLARLIDTMGSRGKASAIYAISNAGQAELFSFLPGLAADLDPDISARASEAIRILFMEGHRISMPESSFAQSMETRCSEGSEIVVSPELKPFSRKRIRLERLLFDVESPIVHVRLKALGSLAVIGDGSCLDAVQVATRDSEMAVRIEAQATFKALKALEVRATVAASGIRGRMKALDRRWLVEQLQSPSRLERIKALKRVGPRDGHVLEALINHIEVETDPFVRPILSTVVGMLGDGLSIPRLIPLLRDQEPRVRANTVEALRYLNDDSVYGHFVTLLMDPSTRVRRNVETALAEYVSNSSGPRDFAALEAIESLICVEKDFGTFEAMIHSALDFLTETKADTAGFLNSLLGRIQDPVRVQRLLELAGVTPEAGQDEVEGPGDSFIVFEEASIVKPLILEEPEIPAETIIFEEIFFPDEIVSPSEDAITLPEFIGSDDDPFEAPLSGSFVICTEDFSEVELRRLIDRHVKRLGDEGDLSWMASYQLSRIDDPRVCGILSEYASRESGSAREKLEKVISTLRVLERAHAGGGMSAILSGGGAVSDLQQPEETTDLSPGAAPVAVPSGRSDCFTGRRRSDPLASLSSRDRQYVERILDKRIDKSMREDAAATLSTEGSDNTFKFLDGFKGEADSYARYLMRLVCERAGKARDASYEADRHWEPLFSELSGLAEAGDPAFADKARAAFRTFGEKDREKLLSRLEEKFPDAVISLSMSMLDQDDSNSQLFALGFLSRIPRILSDEFEIIQRIFDMYRFSPYDEIRFVCGRILDGAGRKRELMETMMASRKSKGDIKGRGRKGDVKWRG